MVVGVQEEKSSEAKENLVILHMAASLMECVRMCVYVHVCVLGRAWSAGKGCVYPICSLYHVVGKTTG